MNRVFRTVWLVLKWVIVGLICIEVLSFIAITVTNFILYGHAREGSRAVYDPYTLFLQSSGPRATAYNPTSSEPGKKRIVWMLGGSTMRGSTDFDDKTLPSFVAQYLNSGSQPLRVTVKNYGMNSFNSLLETKYLQKLFIEKDQLPEIILFYDGANDAKYYAEHRNRYAHHGYRRVSSLIDSYYRSWFGLFKPLNAALYSSYTRELYDKINQVFVPIDPDSPEFRKWVDSVVRRYRHVDKISACYGAHFILVWQPIWWVEQCHVAPELKRKEQSFIMRSEKFAAMRRNFSIPYEALSDRLRHEPYFVSMRNALCDRTSTVYKPDGVHLTDQGRKMVAIRIGRLLEQRLRQMKAEADSGCRGTQQ